MKIKKQTNEAPAAQEHGSITDLKIFRFFYDNAYIFLSFAVSAFIMLFVFFIYKLVPFGDKTILRMDLYHQYGPLFSELFSRIVHGDSMVYSWYTGMGGSFLGNFYNYLSSPLSFLIVLFGDANITEAISFFILTKSALSAAMFCYFLKKAYGVQDFTCTAFSVLYSVCGYFLAYYWNVMWLDGMVLFPLIALGIQYIIKEKKWLLYTISLAVMMFANYYIAMMLCIVSVLYFIVFYFSEFSVDEDGFWKRLFSRGGIFALSSLASAGLSAFSLLPTYFALQSSSATNGNFPKNFKMYFGIFDFFANHLAAIDPTIRSSGDDVLPNVYCGVIVLILVPLYLFLRSIPIREKVCHLSLLGLLYISFNFNILNYIWHGFHFPNDLPYRFSFVYSFIVLVMSFRVMQHIREIPLKSIAASVIGVLAFIALVEKVESKNADEITILASAVFVILYAFIFIMLKSKRVELSTFKTLILICAFLELSVCTPNLYAMDQSKANYASDKPFVQALLNKITAEDPGFYRMEISDGRTLNDPAWYGYNGISTFSSMAYEKVSYLSDRLGLDTNRINSYKYRMQTPAYNAMCNLKYILSKEPIDDPDMYEPKFVSGQYYIYENKYNLPIGFAVDDAVLTWDIKASNPFEVQNDFYQKALNTNAPVLEEMEINELRGVECTLTNVDKRFGTQSYAATGSGIPSINISLKATKTRHVYLYVKSDKIGSVSITAPKTSKTTEISEAYIIDMGLCNAGQNVQVSLKGKSNDSGSFTYYAYGVEPDNMRRAVTELSKGGFNVTEYDDTYLVGTANIAADSVMYTSIPYDKRPERLC